MAFGFRSLQLHILSAAFLAAVLATGCSDPPQSSAPSPRSETLSIGGGQALEQGQTVTLTLSVRLSDGTTQVPTSGVTWTSDDPAIATVTQGGVVTALAPGEAKIRAAYSGITATTTMAIRARTRVIRAVVSESAPTESVVIPGARVVVTDATGEEQTVIADAAGGLSVTVRSGPVRFAVTANGYEPAAVSQEPDTSSSASLHLRPVLREIRETFLGAQPDVSQRTFSIAVHHDGELQTGIVGCANPGCNLSASGFGMVCAEVRDQSNRVIASEHGQYDIGPWPFRIQIKGGQRYEVKLFACSEYFTPISVGRLHYEIKHPS